MSATGGRLGARPRLRRRQTPAPRLGAEGWALVTGVATAAIACVLVTRGAYQQDTWLALVAGREVIGHGIPHHDVLTTLGSGHQWVDQQWATQTFMYGLDRLFGPASLGVVQVLLLTGSLAAAVILARVRDASTAVLLLLLPWCTYLLLDVGFEVRTQTYAYPLFLLLMAMLLTDARRPSARVLLALPLLAAWSNVHGSVTIAAGLVVLRGLTLGWESLRAGADRRKRLGCGAALIIGAPAAMLASPYGASALTYYHRTLLEPTFRAHVTEWRPPTSDPALAVALFALCALLLLALLRVWRSTTAWERLALPLLALGAALALRNVAWFALGALAIGSSWLSLAIHRERRDTAHVRVTLHRVVAATAATTAIALLGYATARGTAWFVRGYPDSTAEAVAAIERQAPLDVYADTRYADWLLWRLPALRHRVAFDARFEVFGPRTVDDVIRLQGATGQGWKRAVRGIRLLVLPLPSPDAEAFGDEAGARVLDSGGGATVILRSQLAAARG